MTLDPDCAAVLREARAWNRLESPTAAGVRARELKRHRYLSGGLVAVAEVADMAIPGPAGPVPVRVYRPTADAPRGVLVWLHGGAFIAGSIATFDDQARALARTSGCAVLSVDYRLAPEHPFPAGLEDCFAAVEWAAAHVRELATADAEIAVAGDSAGGNLAAAVTLMAREHGGPSIACQLLVYPVLSFVSDFPSRHEFAEGYGLGNPGEPRWTSAYLPDPNEAANPLASPLVAPSLSGLPPAVILTAELDPLRDEGERYARLLEEAGVPVRLRRFDGMVHGFMAYAGRVRGAADAFCWAGGALGAALGTDPPDVADELAGALLPQEVDRSTIA